MLLLTTYVGVPPPGLKGKETKVQSDEQNGHQVAQRSKIFVLFTSLTQLVPFIESATWAGKNATELRERHLVVKF